MYQLISVKQFIHDDEVGYDNLFHFTFDKEKNKIVQADFVSQTGGDGG
ncbi:MAG: hypothetical protein IPO92_20205 [Saprospiraceae bacterium]|nr:hypothetical protein [Saprospiraceae bacterium]